MIRIHQIKLEPAVFAKKEMRDTALLKKAALLLRVEESFIQSCTLVKQSVDARKKPQIFYSLSVDVSLCAGKEAEEGLLKRCKNHDIVSAADPVYRFPATPLDAQTLHHRPVIIGSGPAGLFCAYLLALHGYRPLVLERGEDVDSRLQSVETFWKTGKLKPASNVQFGEGGAGTFSDGKLNTLVKDKDGRNKEVLSIFVREGAPEQILYENKPHLGTDLLIPIVKNMRNTIIAHGGEVLFASEVTDVHMEGNRLTGLTINGSQTIACDAAVFAIGHSARNTFETLYRKGIPMEAKAFAVGLRVEHLQTVINLSQYGNQNPPDLPAADYKLTAQAANGRGVYSFCMCPGGYVVDASSEEERLAINGMSYSLRDGIHGNSAVIVSVTPEDYGIAHPLAGIAFQRSLEEKAFVLGGGRVPVQYYKDFKDGIESEIKENGRLPQMKGAYTFSNLRTLMPEALNTAFIEGMEAFSRKIKGFADDDTLLSGIESRTSSPVRIIRDDTLQSTISGLYPCGEGAGYAGGITSAAMDGIKVAEEIAKKYFSC